MTPSTSLYHNVGETASLLQPLPPCKTTHPKQCDTPSFTTHTLYKRTKKKTQTQTHTHTHETHSPEIMWCLAVHSTWFSTARMKRSNSQAAPTDTAGSSRCAPSPARCIPRVGPRSLRATPASAAPASRLPAAMPAPRTGGRDRGECERERWLLLLLPLPRLPGESSSSSRPVVAPPLGPRPALGAPPIPWKPPRSGDTLLVFG